MSRCRISYLSGMGVRCAKGQKQIERKEKEVTLRNRKERERSVTMTERKEKEV